jgi:hypothetical protein
LSFRAASSTITWPTTCRCGTVVDAHTRPARPAICSKPVPPAVPRAAARGSTGASQAHLVWADASMYLFVRGRAGGRASERTGTRIIGTLEPQKRALTIGFRLLCPRRGGCEACSVRPSRAC